MNKNRIVRVRNKLVWELVRHAARQTGLSHQCCFDEILLMVEEGFLLTSETSYPLFQRLTEKMKAPF